MTVSEYLKYCNKGNYIAKGTYYYVQNNQSTMRKMYGSNKFDYTKLGNLDVSDKILKIGNQYGKKMKCGAEYRYVRNRLWVLMNMIFCRCKDDELFDRIGLISREQLKSYLKNPQSTVMESICAVGMYINPKLLYYMGVTIGLPIQWIIKRKVLN